MTAGQRLSSACVCVHVHVYVCMCMCACVYASVDIVHVHVNVPDPVVVLVCWGCSAGLHQPRAPSFFTHSMHMCAFVGAVDVHSA